MPTTPSPARQPIVLLILFFLAVLCPFSALAAQPSTSAEPAPLTATDALALARARADLHDLQTARQAQAQARITTARTFSNPSLELHREADFTGSDREAETALQLSQTLPLNGRRRLQTQAAESTLAATNTESERLQNDVAHQTRQAFYALLYAQQSRTAHQHAIDRITNLLTTMEQRVQAGQSSTYELERLRLLHADLSSDLHTATARQQRLQADLATLIDRPPDDLLATGDLLPPDPHTTDALDHHLDQHPDLRRSAHLVDALNLRHRAARRAWIPDLELTAGLSSRPDHLGYIAGLAIDLPVFQRRQGQQDLLAATRIEIQTTARRFRVELHATARALLTEANALHDASQTYQTQAVQRAHRLLELTHRAYTGDEASLLELIDAHQSTLDAELRLLALSYQSRQAYLELLHRLSVPGDTL